MPSEEIVFDLIARIYDSALDSSKWTSFLEAFSSCVNGASTILLYHDMAALRGNVSAGVRYDPNVKQLYDTHFGACDPWRAAWLEQFSRAGPDGIVTSEQVLAPAELRKTEFYNDFLVPCKLVHQFCGPISVNRDWSAVLTCLRSADKGPFGSEDVDLLRHVLPHLQKALQLHRRIASLETERSASLESLDRLAAGFILVNATAQVLFMNRAAKQIVDRKDGLMFGSSVLSAANSSETRELRKVIGQTATIDCGSPSLAGSCGALTLSRPSGRAPFSLIVIPVLSEYSHAQLRTGNEAPRAMILIPDPDAEITPDSAILQRSFGLTPAEARLAAILMSGKSLEDAADDLGITRHTARTHLKKIFSKTGTRRQGELIVVLLKSFSHLRTLPR